MAAKKRNISELKGNILCDLHLSCSLIKFWFVSDFLKLGDPVIEYLWETGLPFPSRRPLGPT